MLAYEIIILPFTVLQDIYNFSKFRFHLGTYEKQGWSLHALGTLHHSIASFADLNPYHEFIRDRGSFN